MIVSALVLLVAIRSIVRNMGRKDSFDNVLKQEIDNWVNRNRPLISEDKDFSNGTRYFMLTDHEHILILARIYRMKILIKRSICYYSEYI